MGHPDLEPNLWVNRAELEGMDGIDDDGNGYVDDVYGWVFIDLLHPASKENADSGLGIDAL